MGDGRWEVGGGRGVPVAKHLSLSPGMALAVMAMMGRWARRGSFRISSAAVYPSITGIY